MASTTTTDCARVRRTSREDTEASDGDPKQGVEGWRGTGERLNNLQWEQQLMHLHESIGRPPGKVSAAARLHPQKALLKREEGQRTEEEMHGVRKVSSDPRN